MSFHMQLRIAIKPEHSSWMSSISVHTNSKAQCSGPLHSNIHEYPWSYNAGKALNQEGAVEAILHSWQTTIHYKYMCDCWVSTSLGMICCLFSNVIKTTIFIASLFNILPVLQMLTLLNARAHHNANNQSILKGVKLSIC